MHTKIMIKETNKYFLPLSFLAITSISYGETLSDLPGIYIERDIDSTSSSRASWRRGTCGRCWPPRAWPRPLRRRIASKAHCCTSAAAPARLRTVRRTCARPLRRLSTTCFALCSARKGSRAPSVLVCFHRPASAAQPQQRSPVPPLVPTSCLFPAAYGVPFAI